MSYFNYDPFFDNEDNNKKNQSQQNDINPFFDEENNSNQNQQNNSQTHNWENRYETPNNWQPDDREKYQRNGYYGDDFNRFGSSNNNGNYNPPTKSPLTLSKVLLIILPIILLTNLVTSILVFNYVWTDAKREYSKEISQIISDKNKTGYIPVSDLDFLSYNIAKSEMDSVLEITAKAPNETSSGTGFIISSDGYILTNAHVVTYSSSIFQGVGPNGSSKESVKPVPELTAKFEGLDISYNLEVIAYDTELDLAVCKFVDMPTKLHVTKFGNSVELQYGEPCVAIGNAQGYGLAVTEGIVSAPIQYYNLSSRGGALTAAVQHSAAINPGNSGGPLYNMYGFVIGINSFKLTGNTKVAIDGMGFAIPSAVAKDYVNGLNIDGLHISYTEPPKADSN